MINIIYQKDWINDEWFTDVYQQHKQENFDLLDTYLETPPKKILDIGCGLAWESRLFNKKHGTELYLLDGDFDDNAQDSRVQQQARYTTDSKNFAFYYKLDFLQNKLDELNTQNYHSSYLIKMIK